ncbi:MAG: hypothetical protein AABW51_01050 [Nanoarchaeota archaeon]
MKRGSRLFLGVVILLVILSLSVVSASWFSDVWGKITGQPVKVVDDGSFVGSTASTPSCTDSDGGLNYILKGTVYGQDTNSTNYIINDSCSGNSVVEYYCNQNTSSFAAVTYACTNLGANYVCSNGACINSSQTNTTSYFDLATTAITFSDNTPEVGQLVMITKTVKNLGNVNGYITGGSASTCLLGDSSGCAGGGWGSKSPGELILAGGIKYDYENYTFNKAGTWELKRSYNGKGIHNETDINLANNFKTVYINVSANSTHVTCADSDGGYNYNIQGTATYQGQTYNDYCVQNGTYAGWVYEYACNSGALGTGVYNCASSGGVCNNGACVSSNNTFSWNPFYLTYISYPGSSILDVIWLGDIQTYLSSKNIPSLIVDSKNVTRQKIWNTTSVISVNKSTIVVYPGNWMSILYAVEAGNIQTYLKSYVDSHSGFRTCNQLISAESLTSDNFNDAFSLCSSWYGFSSTCTVTSSDVKEVPEGTTKSILGLNVYVASADENNLVLRAMISVNGQYFNLSTDPLGSDLSFKIISVDGGINWYRIDLVSASDTMATIKVGSCASSDMTLSCSDSDGGWYPYARGTATVGSNPELRYTDFCLANGSSNTLHEYSCSADNILAGGDFACPYGCLNGVCKTNPQSKCTFFGRIFKSAACKAAVAAEKSTGSDLNN